MNSRRAAGDGIRRTSRVGKQRIMMVDGVPVLKLNNYDLLSGERSVFDQELNRESPSTRDTVSSDPATGHTLAARSLLLRALQDRQCPGRS